MQRMHARIDRGKHNRMRPVSKMRQFGRAQNGISGSGNADLQNPGVGQGGCC